MSFAAAPNTDQNRIERLLGALEGVVSARVVLDSAGRIIEVHILASHELHPKQIVRNVESALSAGFGILIDRRVVSVAQLRPEATEFPIARSELEELTVETPKRHLFVGFETSASAPLDATCEVTLTCSDRHVTGTGNGANTAQGRAEAAARALFDALTICHDDLKLGFEGATVIEVNNRAYVLVAAHSISGRRTKLLTGIAAITRSPEEAAILASLQATNRAATQSI